MCEYKVGDVVRNKDSGINYTVSAVWGERIAVTGYPSTYPTDAFDLVERKPEAPASYIFKVGDKGKRRDGIATYEVLSIVDTPGGKKLVALITLTSGRGYTTVLRELDGRFAHDQKKESNADLMPPSTYVWRIDCKGVRDNGKRNGGLVYMEATRTYATEAEAIAGFNRALKAYAEVLGPFKEEKV